MTKRLEDTYSFTTTETDDYFPRVVAEARKESNFLLVINNNVRTGTKSLVLLVNKRILNIGDQFPDLELCSKPLKDWLDMSLNSPEEWIIAIVRGEEKEINKEINIVREQVKRINNAIAGRNIKVTVTAL